jgi:uncharacterized protein (DUF2336 family)
MRLAEFEGNLPEDILVALAQDEHWQVRRRVARRTQDLPPQVARILAKFSDYPYIPWYLTIRDQKMPLDVLQALAKSGDTECAKRAKYKITTKQYI